jgi:hypothetical protein
MEQLLAADKNFAQLVTARRVCAVRMRSPHVALMPRRVGAFSWFFACMSGWTPQQSACCLFVSKFVLNMAEEQRAIRERRSV